VSGKLEEALALPSSGDTSYARLVFHQGFLLVSYYSSHEGKASIYLAKVKLPPPSGQTAAIIDIGSRRELLVDDFLVERFSGAAQLRLHPPAPREAVFVIDKPWEGCMGATPP
jgi:hypothetical protein